jgi:hypothetical protein
LFTLIIDAHPALAKGTEQDDSTKKTSFFEICPIATDEAARPCAGPTRLATREPRTNLLFTMSDIT